MILGLTGVSLLGAFGISIAGSAEHRGLSTVDTVLKGFSEGAVFQIQLETSPLYVSCPTYSSANVAVGSTATVTAASGNGTTATYTANNNFVAGETINVAGLQVASGGSLNIIGTLVTATPTQFTISSSVSGASSGEGTAAYNYSYASYNATNLTAYTPPSTFTVAITAIHYWNGTDFSDTTCNSTVPAPELITATASGPSAGGKLVSDSYTFVVIDPTQGGYFSVGAPTHLAFLQSPSTEGANVAFTSQPIVAVEDANDNIVTTNTSTITLSLSGTGPTGAKLTCAAMSLAAVSGVADFSGCNIDIAGTGYTLTGTDTTTPSLTSAVSSPFTVGTVKPAIASVTPSSIPQNVSTPYGVTILGSGFEFGAKVTFSNGGVTVQGTTQVGSTQLNVSITTLSSATVGAGTLTVTNPDATTVSAAFSVVSGTASITASPSDPRVNNSDTVLISGSGFAPNSALSVTVSSGPVTTNITTSTNSSGVVVSNTSFVMTNPSSVGTTVTATVTDSSANSATASFKTTAPTLLFVSPSSLKGAANPSDTVTISGSGYAPNSVLTATVSSGKITTALSTVTDASGNIPVGASFVMDNPSGKDITVTVTVIDAIGHSASDPFQTT